jgi:hypothetical protein
MSADYWDKALIMVILLVLLSFKCCEMITGRNLGD